MISKRLSRRMSSNAASSSISWSNKDYAIQEFIKEHHPPQIVRIKQDKASTLKTNSELVIHETRTWKKVEGIVVSEKEKFMISYDCPAKVYQLSKSEEYESVSELRNAIPTCRFILTTREIQDSKCIVKKGEILTIVFKKNINGEDVFTCQRKKKGAEQVEISGKTTGGFAAMATTQEKKINEFIRSYSTFPVGICFTQATIDNPLFKSLNQILSNADSLLVRLTKHCDTNCTIFSTLNSKKRTVFCIPSTQEITVTAPKALLSAETKVGHDLYCREQHEMVDMKCVSEQMGLQMSLDVKAAHTLQWVYGHEGHYDEVVPKTSEKKPENVKKTKDDSKHDKVDSKTKDEEKLAKEKAKEERIAKERAKEEERIAKEKAKEEERIAKKNKKEEKMAAKERLKKEKEEKKLKMKAKDVAGSDSPQNHGTSHEAITTASPVAEEQTATELLEDNSGYLVPQDLLNSNKGEVPQPVEILEGEYDIPEDAEKSNIASSFGRFLGRVKGPKDKKKERPASEIVTSSTNKSATMPLQNIKQHDANDKKSKTLSTIDVDMKDVQHTSGGSTSHGSDDKKKNILTFGKKAGAKLKILNLKKTKHHDQEIDDNYDDIDDNDGVMYVSPVDHHDNSITTIAERPLPDKPVSSDNHHKISRTSSHNDYDNDDELYDEIDPQPSRDFKIPKDLSKLNVEGVCDVLRHLNMSEHVSKFRRDQIDGEIFKMLDDQLLGALGIADPIQRLKLKKLLKGWRPKTK